MGRQEHTTQKWARDTLEMRRVKTERNHKSSNTLTEKTLPARILETNVSSDFCHVYSVIASFFLSHDIHIYHHMTSTYIITTYVHRYHHVWSCVRMGEMFVTCRVWKKKMHRMCYWEIAENHLTTIKALSNVGADRRSEGDQSVALHDWAPEGAAA